MSCQTRMRVVVLLATMVLMMDCYASASDHGLGLLNDILKNDPSQLCSYVSCQEPVTSDNCPNNTMYLENTAQFGCCGACVAFRQIDEACTGSIEEGYTTTPNANIQESLYNKSDNVVQSSWCGYGLTCSGNCTEEIEAGSCRSMLNAYISDSPNFKFYKDDYRWKPDCTSDGKFAPKQCKGPLSNQRCVCVDPDGDRLFGDAFPAQEELFNTMNCKCSRLAWEMERAGQSSATLHCLANGNFDPLQCEDGWCHCVHTDTAEAYGFRLPEAAMHLLPCYNKSLVGEMYLRRCDSELYAHTKLVDAMDKIGVRGPYSFTSCDQDGSYASRQCDQTMCRCYDKYMDQAIAFPSGDGCQCARDSAYYKESNSNIAVSCIVGTGLYTDVQIQGELKYCVDSDGIRSGPLVLNKDKYLLDCNNVLRCQTSGMNNDLCLLQCVKSTSNNLGESVPCEDEAYIGYDSTQP